MLAMGHSCCGNTTPREPYGRNGGALISMRALLHRLAFGRGVSSERDLGRLQPPPVVWRRVVQNLFMEDTQGM